MITGSHQVQVLYTLPEWRLSIFQFLLGYIKNQSMSIILVHIKHKFYVALFGFQSSMYPTQPSLWQALCGPTLPVYISQTLWSSRSLRTKDVRIVLGSVPLPTLAVLPGKELQKNV